MAITALTDNVVAGIIIVREDKINIVGITSIIVTTMLDIITIIMGGAAEATDIHIIITTIGDMATNDIDPDIAVLGATLLYPVELTPAAPASLAT